MHPSLDLPSASHTVTRSHEFTDCPRLALLLLYANVPCEDSSRCFGRHIVVTHFYLRVLSERVCKARQTQKTRASFVSRICLSLLSQLVHAKVLLYKREERRTISPIPQGLQLRKSDPSHSLFSALELQCKSDLETRDLMTAPQYVRISALSDGFSALRIAVQWTAILVNPNIASMLCSSRLESAVLFTIRRHDEQKLRLSLVVCPSTLEIAVQCTAFRSFMQVLFAPLMVIMVLTCFLFL
jgi:hypothetical protein